MEETWREKESPWLHYRDRATGHFFKQDARFLMRFCHISKCNSLWDCMNEYNENYLRVFTWSWASSRSFPFQGSWRNASTRSTALSSTHFESLHIACQSVHASIGLGNLKTHSASSSSYKTDNKNHDVPFVAIDERSTLVSEYCTEKLQKKT